MCEYKLEYQKKEYPFDGRLITKEDKVEEIYFFPNKVTVFANDNNYVRVVGPNQEILINFDDGLSEDDIIITDNYLVYVDMSLNFQIMDFTGAVLFTHPAVESFEVIDNLIIFKCYCEDGLSRMMIYSLIHMDLLTTLEDDIEEFKVSSDGKIFKKARGYQAVLEQEGKIFDHGFDRLVDARFVGNVTILTGYIKRKKTNRIFINDKLVGYTPYDLEVINGHNGESVITQVRGNKTLSILFDKNGESLERFKNHEGKFQFFETGVLCRNLKNGKCMFITGDGVPVYTYDLNLNNICYHSNDFNVASRNYTPKQIMSRMMDDGDFDLIYHIDPKKVPLFYLNNAFRVSYNGSFVIIQKGIGQEYNNYSINDSCKTNGMRVSETFYFTTIVLNNDLKVVSKAEAIESGKISSLTVPVKIRDMYVSFMNEEGEEIYYDENGNEYSHEPIIGNDKEVYLVIDDSIVPYRLPGVSDDIIKAVVDGRAVLKKADNSKMVIGEKKVKGLVNPIKIC